MSSVDKKHFIVHLERFNSDFVSLSPFLGLFEGHVISDQATLLEVNLCQNCLVVKIHIVSLTDFRQVY
jgi:hypothetical protein